MTGSLSALTLRRFAYFSAFSNLPASVLLSDQTGYMAASAIGNNNITWAFQSDKIIPIKSKNKLFTFTLSSWALSKQEV